MLPDWSLQGVSSFCTSFLRDQVQDRGGTGSRSGELDGVMSIVSGGRGVQVHCICQQDRHD